MDNINIASPMVAHYEDLVKSDEDREDMLQFYYEHVHNHYEDLFRWIIFSAPRLEKEYVEELHQETLLKALEHRHQLRDIEKCKTWRMIISPILWRWSRSRNWNWILPYRKFWLAVRPN